MTGAKERRPPFVVALRGPAGAGKTTLAEAVREAAPGRAAIIDTDPFQWEIVPREPDKRLVYSNALLPAHNYLRNGYGVVLSGLIPTREEAGAMEELRGFACAHDAPFLDLHPGSTS